MNERVPKYHPEVEAAYATNGEDIGRVKDEGLAEDLAHEENRLRESRANPKSGANPEKVKSLVYSRAKFILAERALDRSGINLTKTFDSSENTARSRYEAGKLIGRIGSDLNQLEADAAEFRDSREAIDHAVAALGNAFHENWRKTRLNEDGTFEPRVKTTEDEAWIKANGTDQIDIANTTYESLPVDWQTENKAAAEVVVSVLNERKGNVDLGDPDTRVAVGEQIHAAWLSRNIWARGGDLDVPFVDLPVDEQNKDLDQVIVAQNVFGHER